MCNLKIGDRVKYKHLYSGKLVFGTIIDIKNFPDVSSSITIKPDFNPGGKYRHYRSGDEVELNLNNGE